MASIPPLEPMSYAEPEAPAEARWELLRRVASSAAFQKSRRLREFLVFVCERALRDPENVVHEQEIGTTVFGRPADFDPSQDTLVRVHASQLRKRLQQYFGSEGADEPVLIEIPKGTYMPAFRSREPGARAPRGGELSRGSRAHPRWLVPALGGLAVVLAAGASWLLLENRQLRERLSGGLPPQPAVDRLWLQIFGNGQHTYVVLADSTFTMFQDLIHLQVSPTDYQRQRFKALADARLRDPLTLDFAVRLMNRQFTSVADANLARRVTLLNATHGIRTEVLLARDAGPGHFKSHNAVLSGPRRSNPWLEFFEGKLNFRSGFDEEPRLAYFENVAPLPGEERRYAVSWDRVGYCRVAYLPNLDATGSVLIISGTDMNSSDAGAEFISSERWVTALRSALGVSADQPLPHFEVLLRAQLLVGAAPSFDMIALRTHRF